MKQYLGIRDIAKLAGVSVATVSRVINNPEKVSLKTVENVNKIIKENNYVPNILAKDLYNQSNRSIALFILDLDCTFFIALIQSLNRIAFENKYALLICNTENSTEKEKEYLRYCTGIRTKGIIFTEGHSKDIFSSVSNQTLVFHDRYVNNNYSCVMSDNYKGIKLLVDYLYNLNHRKFAFIGDNPLAKSVEARKNAFISVLRDKGIEVPKENIVSGTWTTRTGVDAFDYICTLSDRPTAIVCANDAVARGFVVRANKMGLRIPEDFSIVGFDGYTPEYFYPRLTTIKQDVDAIAQHLFNCVIQPPNPPTKIIVDVEMIMGDSCRKINN